MAFVLAHTGVTSAIVGPRTMAHLDDLLAGVDVSLPDGVLGRIDAIVPPAPTSAGSTWPTPRPPSRQARLRRRPVDERVAA
jgi:hypothetical protein